MSRPPIILASGSPRRRDLLASLGIDFDVVIPDVDETQSPGEDPGSYVVRLARAKAAAVSDAGPASGPRSGPGRLVIAADTTVALGEEIIGKPIDRADAERILRRLSGRTHSVYSGVALAYRDTVVSELVRTSVSFCDLSEADIEWYVATGEPDDKAGAYGMQGTGNVFVDRIDGNPSNVIGLPLPTVIALARELGVQLLGG